MQEYISQQEHIPGKTDILDTARVWTDGLRLESGLPVDAAAFVDTTKYIAGLYGLDYGDVTGRKIIDAKLAHLALLHTSAQATGAFEQPTLNEEVDAYAHVPEPAQLAAMELVAMTVDQAYALQDNDSRWRTWARRAETRTGRLRHSVRSLASQRQDLRRQARYDALTGALNILGSQEIEQRWIYEHSQDAHRAVVTIDATCFKEPNDVLGHAVGDELLVEMVREMRSHMRGSDGAYITRAGGDEFMIMLDNIPREGFASLVRRMQATQAAKVAEGKNIDIWERIRSKQRKGPLDVRIGERLVAEDLKEEMRRHLYVNGEEVCSLRDLAVLSIGGDHALVLHHDDPENMKKRANQVLAAHKTELHKQMGGAYRTRSRISFLYKAVRAAQKMLRA